MKKRMLQSVLVLLAAVLPAGCGNGDNRRLWESFEQLKRENTDLSLQAQALQQENAQLSEQVQTLAGMDQQVRLQQLDTLQTVRLGKRTGLYDFDENGTKETLVVYVEPLDSAQDHIKAVGTVDVQLWDLNAAPEAAKLAQWTRPPEAIQKHWGGSIFASYYRLPFAVFDVLTGQEQELTVKVTFTDHLTGKVLGDQVTITP